MQILEDNLLPLYHHAHTHKSSSPIPMYTKTQEVVEEVAVIDREGLFIEIIYRICNSHHLL